MGKNFKNKKFKGKGKDFRTNSKRPGVNTNSADWYYPDPHIQQLASAVNLNFRNGNKVNFADGVNLTNSSLVLDHMPGVAVNPILHVPGRCTSPTDAPNEASRSMMNRIREHINATRDYEMPDLLNYILAISDLHAWIGFLNRIYRTAASYNPLNRYQPLALLRGMRVDTSDINNLVIQLDTYLSLLTSRVENLKLPTEVQFVNSWVHDYEEIYVDEDIAKAQFIFNVPQYVLKFTIDTTTHKGKVVPQEFRSRFSFNNPATVDDLIDFTEELLVEIINDEDFAIITADIMKSYTGFHEARDIISNMHTPIEFTYSKEYLEKWHNSVQFTGYYNREVTGWEITQDTTSYLDPFVVFNPKFKAPNQDSFDADRRYAGNKYLDFYEKDVTSDQIINGCLWMIRTINLDEDNLTYEIDPVSTSICGNTDIIFYDNQEQLVCLTYGGNTYWNRESNNRMSVTINDLYRMILLTKWNYHPMTILMVLTSAEGNEEGYLGVLGDFGNYTIVDSRILENIRNCVLYGQFNVKSLL